MHMHVLLFLVNREAKHVVPLYCYYHAGVSDHLYTSNSTEIGTVVPGNAGKNGFLCEGIECLVYAKQVEGSVPLHRYWNMSAENHLYTVNVNEIGTTTIGHIGKNGYKYEGVAGYCFKTHRLRLHYEVVPLYRYWNRKTDDHFYTIHLIKKVEEEQGNVFTQEGVECYVLMKKGL